MSNAKRNGKARANVQATGAHAPGERPKVGFARGALVCLLLLAIPRTIIAQESDLPHKQVTLDRRIFVPLDTLPLLLEHQPNRVILQQDEYQKLVELAEERRELQPPGQALLLSADYQFEVQTGRAVIAGELVIDVLADGVHGLALPLAGVGLRAAHWDGAPASLRRAEDGQVVLLVSGKGQKKLSLELVAPLQTTSALQTLQLQLPTPSATQVRMRVPGDVEIKSGAKVIERMVDDQTNTTRFRLLPQSGPLSIVMSLNNRQLQKQYVAVARSVIVDEIRQPFERLHVSAALEVLHGETDKLRFAIPAGFDVTEVDSPAVDQWQVINDGDARTLQVALHEAAEGTVVCSISATRRVAPAQEWTFPRFEVLDVAGQVAIVGVLVEDRLQLEDAQPAELVQISAGTLDAALPATLSQPDPLASPLRRALAFYVPQTAYQLRGTLRRLAPEFSVTSTQVLSLAESGLELQSELQFTPEVEPLFSLSIQVPAGWRINHAQLPDGALLTVESQLDQQQATVRLQLPRAIAPGQSQSVLFKATQVPDGWLGTWRTFDNLAIPDFNVRGAARSRGAIAIRGDGDLVVRPLTVQNLTALTDTEKARYGLADIPANLVYRFDSQPYSGSIQIHRRKAVITAHSHSFFAVDTNGLSARYELHYDVQEASERNLSFSLPLATPDSLAIRGLDGVEVKEYESRVVDDRRHWKVLLADARQGTVKLAVQYQQPLPQREFQDELLPLIEATNVAYQSSSVAVEGSAELDVRIATDARAIDAGELADAQYAVGKRLIGVFGFPGTSTPIRYSVARRAEYGLPTTIVERAELQTALSAYGAIQTAARFQLKTKAQYLEIQLPAGARLWTVMLDGQPAKPQRDQNHLLLSLSTTDAKTARDVQVVYETYAAREPRFMNSIVATALTLSHRSTAGSAPVPIPVADLQWRVQVPEGFRICRNRGSVELVDPDRQRFSLLTWLATPYTRHRNDSQAVEDVSHYMSQKKTPATFTDALAPDYEAMESSDDSPMSQPATIAGGIESAATPAPSTEEKPPAEPPATPDANAPADGQATMHSGPFGAQPTDTPAQQGGQAAQPGSGAGPSRRGWALAGLRSLPIELTESREGVTFRSLGRDPALDLMLVDRARVDALATATALLLALIGVSLTNRSLAIQASFVIWLLLLACVLTMLGTIGNAFFPVFDAAFTVACVALVYFVVARLAIGIGRLFRWRWSARTRRVGRRAAAATTATALLIAVYCFHGTAQAQDAVPPDADLKTIVQALKELHAAPIAVPDDAVIIPYDADDPQGPAKAQRVLVPRKRYEELWALANGDLRRQAPPPAAPYGIGGVAYHTRLVDGQDLLVEGELTIDVYEDGPASIPLALEEGVLTQVLIDQAPARLRVVGPTPSMENQAAAAASRAVNPPPAQGDDSSPVLYQLELSGKGPRRMSLQARFRLRRQGGWRIVSGRLPVAIGGALNFVVPEQGAELRLTSVPDQPYWETTMPDQPLATVLADDGRFAFQWRPKVAQAAVDEGLTAQSLLRFDIQEDSIRLTCDLTFEFGRGERDRFLLQAPANYLIERVDGANVRGWSTTIDGALQNLDIVLLKASRNEESIRVVLSRRGAVGGEADLTTFDVPVVLVPQSKLHRGTLILRRSPLLDVRILDLNGLTRVDDAPLTARSTASPEEESPLGIVPLQSYRYIRVPFRLQLQVQPVAPAISAEVQSLVKLVGPETRLETQLNYHVRNRGIYTLRVAIPAELSVEQVVAAGDFRWTVLAENDRRVLAVTFPDGVAADTSLVLRGTLAHAQQDSTYPLPRLQALDVDSQQGEIVVQTDPEIDVLAQQLTGCRPIHLERVHHWLQSEQRATARLALEYRTPDYSGVLRTSRRQPQINGASITYVRVTERAVEETVTLRYVIENAGVQELSFLLPARMQDAIVRANLVRTQNVERVTGRDDVVRVRLQLQEAMTGVYKVFVEQKRLLTKDAYMAAIPEFETGTVDRQFVLLENAGRDELVVEQAVGLQALSRQQQPWRSIAAGLDEQSIAYAYQVQPSDQELPSLRYRTKSRQLVETAGATIDSAETIVILDAQGTYHALQRYLVNNRTEPYLEVQLPAEAELWTASVAEEPVKPGAVSGNATRVRLPLIKTAEGDQNFAVVVTYSGSIGPIGPWRNVRFPLMQAINIQVAMSRVRLWLPEDYQWLNFGGTMKQLQDRSAWQEDQSEYLGKQIKRTMQALQSKNPYDQARAISNLSALEDNLQLQESSSGEYRDNQRLARLNESNRKLLRASQDMAARRLSAEVIHGDNNQDRLRTQWYEQLNRRSRDVVTELGGNFFMRTDEPQPKPSEGESSDFNFKWLQRNKLDNPDQPVDEYRSGKGGRDVAGVIAPPTPPAAKEAAQRGENLASQLRQEMEESTVRQPQSKATELDSRGRAQRYRAQLEQQVQRDASDVLTAGQAVALVDDSTSTLADVQRGPASSAGLTSLGIALPQRGTEVLFSTPRGEIEITATAIASEHVDRFWRILSIAAIIGGGVLIYRLVIRRVGRSRLVHER